MAVTSYVWTRRHPITSGPHLQTIWSSPAGGGLPAPITGGSWTLRRTLYEARVTVRVAAGAGFPMQWWADSEVRLGLKFSPDGTNHGLAEDDEDANVLAMQSLYPVFHGDEDGTNAYSVTYMQHEPLDIKTARRDDGFGAGVVYDYIWVSDGALVLSTGEPPVSIGWVAQLSALWSQ